MPPWTACIHFPDSTSCTSVSILCVCCYSRYIYLGASELCYTFWATLRLSEPECTLPSYAAPIWPTLPSSELPSEHLRATMHLLGARLHCTLLSCAALSGTTRHLLSYLPSYDSLKCRTSPSGTTMKKAWYSVRYRNARIHDWEDECVVSCSYF